MVDRERAWRVHVADSLSGVSRKVVGIGTVNALERQGIQNLAALALRHCPQRSRNHLPVPGCTNFADLAAANDRDYGGDGLDSCSSDDDFFDGCELFI